MMKSEKEIGCWTTLSVKEILDSPWLKIAKESCRLPHGKIISDFYTVWQPDWVLILPKTRSGKWVLTKQYRHGTKTVSLEFPAGIVDKGESPLEAAKRELEEEVSYLGSSFKFLGEFPMNPDRHRGKFYVFVVNDVEKGGNRTQDETENIVGIELSTEELEEKIATGEMNHPLQIAAYFKYKLSKFSAARKFLSLEEVGVANLAKSLVTLLMQKNKKEIKKNPESKLSGF